MRERPAYAYRDDPEVPDFDDRGPVAVMDGTCALCTIGARLISRFDRKGEFRICRTQTPLGSALLTHYGLSPDDPDSWLLLLDGRAYCSIDAFIRAGARVGGIGWALQPLRLLPRGVQDWLYRRIARNRYRVLGRADMCAVPDARLRARLME
ncbi:MAG: DUF393 domain-containing protein [Pseudomonadota bacterium]